MCTRANITLAKPHPDKNLARHIDKIGQGDVQARYAHLEVFPENAKALGGNNLRTRTPGTLGPPRVRHEQAPGEPYEPHGVSIGLPKVPHPGNRNRYGTGGYNLWITCKTCASPSYTGNQLLWPDTGGVVGIDARANHQGVIDMPGLSLSFLIGCSCWGMRGVCHARRHAEVGSRGRSCDRGRRWENTRPEVLMSRLDAIGRVLS